MKKSIVALFSLFVIVSCSDKKDDTNLQITGNIKGLNKGTLYIQKMEDTVMVVLDSIKIDGKATFQSNLLLNSPEMLYLVLDRGTSNSMDNFLMFFAEPGKINIDTESELFYAKAKITGSKNQDLYEEYKKANARYNDQQLALAEDKFNALKGYKTISISENEAKQNAITKRQYLYAINFAINNREHEIAPYIALSEINDATTKYLDTIQKAMSPKVAKSKYGVMLTKYVNDRKQLE